MNRKVLFVIFSAAMMLLLLTTCGPTVYPGEPGIPSGGTYDNPVFDLAGSCPTYQNFTFNLLYSPTDLIITQVHFLSTGWELSCTSDRPGDSTCLGVTNPHITPVRLDVCYRIPYFMDETCQEISMSTPGCPDPVASLLSVECLQGNRVRFVLDTGASWRGRQCVCADVESSSHLCNCEAGSIIYTCQEDPDATTQITCEGEAPIGNFPLAVQFFVEGMSLDTDYPLASRFDDFYSQYIRSCRTVAPELVLSPEPSADTPTAPEVQPQQPAACSTYLKYDTCAAAGCIWWSNETCNEGVEPTPDPCNKMNGDKYNCLENPSCDWDGVSICYSKP